MGAAAGSGAGRNRVGGAQVKRDHEQLERRIESSRLRLVNAPDKQERMLAAEDFVTLCRSRDPWMIAKLERERLARVKR